jgi:hypothetical protein
MQEKEMIKRIGADNMGYWEINLHVEWKRPMLLVPRLYREM